MEKHFLDYTYEKIGEFTFTFLEFETWKKIKVILQDLKLEDTDEISFFPSSHSLRIVVHRLRQCTEEESLIYQELKKKKEENEYNQYLKLKQKYDKS